MDLNKASMAFTGRAKFEDAGLCVETGIHAIITYKGITSTAEEACKRVGIKYTTYANRVRRGKSLDVALNVKRLGQDKKAGVRFSKKDIIEVNGKRIPILEACKEANLKYDTYTARRASGRTIEEALTVGRLSV